MKRTTVPSLAVLALLAFMATAARTGAQPKAEIVWAEDQGVPGVEAWVPAWGGAQDIVHANYNCRVTNWFGQGPVSTTLNIQRRCTYTDDTFRQIGAPVVTCIAYQSLILESRGGGTYMGEVIAHAAHGGPILHLGDQVYPFDDWTITHNQAPPGATRCSTVYYFEVIVTAGWIWQCLLDQWWMVVMPVGSPASW